MTQHTKIVDINTSSSTQSDVSVLIIYTGGTIGMDTDPQTKGLVPFDFERIMEKVPELKRFDFRLTVFSLSQLIDSSDITPNHWIYLATLIEMYYDNYAGFVILHGTDTMAYTASALSFLLSRLSKPVILTGAQLPIGVPRTDARENLIAALEIAATHHKGKSLITEVCIYFDHLLLRGNRAKKIQNVNFTAFASENYPPLIKAGTYMQYNMPYIRKAVSGTLKVYRKMDNRVHIIKLFPGIEPSYVSASLCAPDLKGVVLETFGAGNAPVNPDFLLILEKVIKQGVLVLNISQSHGGNVDQNRYPNGKQLADIGVIGGMDMTTEAAITKMMFLLGNFGNRQELIRQLQVPICGEFNKLKARGDEVNLQKSATF